MNTRFAKKVESPFSKILCIFNEVDKESPASAEIQISFHHLFFQIYFNNLMLNHLYRDIPPRT